MKINCINPMLVTLIMLFSSFCIAEGSYMKHFKEIEVNFEQTESNNSNTHWRNREVNFGYRNIAVSEIVKKIMVISGKEVVGLEQLANRKLTVMMTRAKVIKAVTTLLKCEGFRMIEKEHYFQVTRDKSINRENCIF